MRGQERAQPVPDRLGVHVAAHYRGRAGPGHRVEVSQNIAIDVEVSFDPLGLHKTQAIVVTGAEEAVDVTPNAGNGLIEEATA